MATVATGTTDATGLAALTVPPGSVTVAATTLPAGYTAGTPETVTVTPGQTIKVTLQVQAPEGTVDVSVVDQFGHAVVGAVVTVSE